MKREVFKGVTTPCRLLRYRAYRFEYRHVFIPRWLYLLRYRR